MELKKGENMLKYKDEIQARPKRTWFQTETEKKNAKVLNVLAKQKKTVNSKKRKREEALETSGRLYKKTQKDRIKDQQRSQRGKKSGSANKKRGKKWCSEGYFTRSKLFTKYSRKIVYNTSS